MGGHGLKAPWLPCWAPIPGSRVWAPVGPSEKYRGCTHSSRPMGAPGMDFRDWGRSRSRDPHSPPSLLGIKSPGARLSPLTGRPGAWDSVTQEGTCPSPPVLLGVTHTRCKAMGGGQLPQCALLAGGEEGDWRVSPLSPTPQEAVRRQLLPHVPWGFSPPWPVTP